jgi:hypothetical protein
MESLCDLYCVCLLRTLLGAGLAELGTDLADAPNGCGWQARGRPEMAQHLFRDKAEDFFDFALVHRHGFLGPLTDCSPRAWLL